ncbi:MAG: hypothetical protein ACI936_003620 [Paraglaciecola sp.]|jgi:hypothetical protein
MIEHKQFTYVRRSPSFIEALYFMTDRMLTIGKFHIELETQLLFFAVATL